MFGINMFSAFALLTLFGHTAIANPVSLAPSIPRSPPPANALLFSDRRDPAKESLVDWQDRMISQGKLYRPNVTSTIHSRQSYTYSISDIACGTLVGDASEYNESRDYFCNTMQGVVSGTLLSGYIILTGELCDGNDCIGIFSLAFSTAGYYTSGFVSTSCGPIFDEVASSCPGSTGASAQLSVNNGVGSTTGTVEGQFVPDDNGAVCPANSDTDYCQVHPFG